MANFTVPKTAEQAELVLNLVRRQDTGVNAVKFIRQMYGLSFTEGRRLARSIRGEDLGPAIANGETFQRELAQAVARDVDRQHGIDHPATTIPAVRPLRSLRPTTARI